MNNFKKFFNSKTFEFVGMTFLGFTGLEFVGNKVMFATICSGPSMEPTINKAGDLVFVWCTDEYKVGDVVVAKCPTDPKKQICKRILATSDDIITFQTEYGGIRRFRIPQGHVWLQGDNAQNSNDSRMYGPVALGLLHGKALCRLSLTNSPVFEILPDKPPSVTLVKHDEKTDQWKAIEELISHLEKEESKKESSRNESSAPVVDKQESPKVSDEGKSE